jgi:hypothetical protein
MEGNRSDSGSPLHHPHKRCNEDQFLSGVHTIGTLYPTPLGHKKRRVAPPFDYSGVFNTQPVVLSA